MGSTRLPGKSLMPLWRQVPLLELVMRRVSAAQSLEGVVLATTGSPRDAELAMLGARLGWSVFRGEEADVLGRFAAALDAHPADAVVRVCADNPFIDPGAIDALVSHFQAAQPCDYASNLGPESGLPDGVGAEIVTAGALRRAAAEATDPRQREHVTAFLLAKPATFRLSAVPPPSSPWPRLKLDVDTAADYAALRALAELLPADSAPLWPLPRIVEAHFASIAARGESTEAAPTSPPIA